MLCCADGGDGDGSATTITSHKRHKQGRVMISSQLATGRLSRLVAGGAAAAAAAADDNDNADKAA